jgi:hypothetical protein
VIFFKNLCLLVISLTLVSCYEDNDCSDSSSSTVDIYLSFDVDFEGADTLIYNDNEYIGGCESELLTTQKTNASYQPKMQGIRIEQHNNGAKHSARFDSEYSRIDFFTSDLSSTIATYCQVSIAISALKDLTPFPQSILILLSTILMLLVPILAK